MFRRIENLPPELNEARTRPFASVATMIGPLNEVEAGTLRLNNEPVVNDMPDMEATEPMVFEERMANEPDEVLPILESTRKNLPFGEVVPIPMKPLALTMIASELADLICKGLNKELLAVFNSNR